MCIRDRDSNVSNTLLQEGTYSKGKVTLTSIPNTTRKIMAFITDIGERSELNCSELVYTMGTDEMCIRDRVKACLVHGKTDDIKFKNPESEILAGNLSFTERQAQAILELRLSKLIGLEILALQKEYEELMDKIGQYEDILGNRKTMTKTIKKDLKAIKKEYALPRKTPVSYTHLYIGEHR